ncbi:hypothetical protein GCM10027615_07830 [Plantactinospora veratri]
MPAGPLGSVTGTSRRFSTSQETGEAAPDGAAAGSVPTGGPAASRSRIARAGGGAASRVRRNRAGSATSAAVSGSSSAAGRPSPAGYGEQTSSTPGTTRRASSGPYSRKSARSRSTADRTAVRSGWRLVPAARVRICSVDVSP